MLWVTTPLKSIQNVLPKIPVNSWLQIFKLPESVSTVDTSDSLDLFQGYCSGLQTKTKHSLETRKCKLKPFLFMLHVSSYTPPPPSHIKILSFCFNIVTLPSFIYVTVIMYIFTTCSLSICYMYIWELPILLVNTQYFEQKLVSINTINDLLQRFTLV